MSVIVDLAIFPMGKNEASLSPYVARALNVIQGSGLNYALGPMGTSIEGEWREVWAVVDACYRELERDNDRIYMTVKVDGKKGRANGITGKVESVRQKAGPQCHVDENEL